MVFTAAVEFCSCLRAHQYDSSYETRARRTSQNTRGCFHSGELTSYGPYRCLRVGVSLAHAGAQVTSISYRTSKLKGGVPVIFHWQVYPIRKPTFRPSNKGPGYRFASRGVRSCVERLDRIEQPQRALTMSNPATATHDAMVAKIGIE